MVVNSKRGRERTAILWELVKAGIESIEAACAFLGRSDWLRDSFRLPSAEERERWLQLWQDDTLAWESTLNSVLGSIPPEVNCADAIALTDWCFNRIRSLFETADSVCLDAFFRSIEVRFIVRVFLPCLVETFHRPSTVLSEIVARGDLGLLERVAKIDSTVVHHLALADILSPAHSETGRQRWALLQSALSKPSEGIEPRQVKYRLAAFLRWVADSLGTRLTVPDLWNMFHDLAKAQGHEAGDSDLGTDQETFRKGIQRFAKNLPLAA